MKAGLMEPSWRLNELPYVGMGSWRRSRTYIGQIRATELAKEPILAHKELYLGDMWALTLGISTFFRASFTFLGDYVGT